MCIGMKESEIESRVTLCPDGKYRWTYEVNLYKNMSMFYDLMKVMGVGLGFVFAIMIFVVIKNNIDWDGFKVILWTFLWIVVGVTVLFLIGYWIWAAVSGGRYAALFVMDEEGVTHVQMPKTVRRGEVIGAIGMMVGGASSDITTEASSILASSFTAWKSDFKKVRKVIPVRQRQLIKVNELLTKNRIYVESRADYEFVLEYILQRCEIM